jgi:Type I restriction enzyme R protein N terminus (HSDR_N)
MSPRVFYKIPEEKYLFGKKDSSENRNFPEEKVRQWVLFELLSTYGIHINDIVIEQVVKIGTRKLKADIVIFDSYVPQIVIECKYQEKDLENGLDQAISYANANSINAEFAVCTDGKSWIVRRKIREIWEPVPDIPAKKCASRLELLEFLKIFSHVKPLLAWLYQPIPPEAAKDYFSRLHTFWQVARVHFGEDNALLYTGGEHLLRVLEADPTVSSKHAINKLEIAHDFLNGYLNHQEEPKFKVSSKFLDTDQWIPNLLYRFSAIAHNSRGISHYNVLIIRFILTLLQYLDKTYQAKDYLEITESMSQEFQNYMQSICETTLGVNLPDKFNDELEGILYLCAEKW